MYTVYSRMGRKQGRLMVIFEDAILWVKHVKAEEVNKLIEAFIEEWFEANLKVNQPQSRKSRPLNRSRPF